MCTLDDCFDETYKIWEQTPKVASTYHICDMCGGDIKPGEEYIKFFAAYFGQVPEDPAERRQLPKNEAAVEKLCSPCNEIYHKFSEEHGVEGLPSWVGEDALPECIGGLYYDPETADWCLALMEMNKRFMQTERYKENPKRYGGHPIRLW